MKKQFSKTLIGYLAQIGAIAVIIIICLVVVIFPQLFSRQYTLVLGDADGNRTNLSFFPDKNEGDGMWQYTPNETTDANLPECGEVLPNQFYVDSFGGGEFTVTFQTYGTVVSGYGLAFVTLDEEVDFISGPTCRVTIRH